ncbi:MAG TPA: hypothetical protein VGA15_10765, partial [Bradyrhizobium sp.]
MSQVKRDMERIEGLHFQAIEVALQAKALKECSFPGHSDWVLDQGDDEANRLAYAIGTNRWENGEIDGEHNLRVRIRNTILELEPGLDAGRADPGAETPVRPMAEPSSPTSTLPPPSVVLTTRLSDGCSAVSNASVAVLACLTKPNPRAGHFGAKIAQAAAGRRANNTASR